MPGKPTNQQQLAAENDGLRARLEKAEATLREMLSGEADALFVTGVAGAQMFTLKGADQAYRTLIENMSEGALTLTPEGLVLYANRRFAGMLRMPLEKVIGSVIHNWFAPESRQILQTLLEKGVIDNRREELALAAADGTQVPIYLSESRLHQDGMPDSICMIATDLSEQKRTEAILDADKLEQAILEQAADAIVICDEGGRIIRASKEAQSFYGKDLNGQLFEHAFPLRQVDSSAFLPVGAVGTESRQLVEARLTHNGQEFDFLVSVGHLKGVQNQLLGSVVTLTDITERKTSELALRKSESQLSEALKIARIGYWEYEFATDEFVFNDQYYTLHKITAEEVGGYRMSSADFARRYVHPEDAPLIAQHIQMAFESTKPDYSVMIEMRMLTGDGEIVWMEARFKAERDVKGRAFRVIGVVQDITERKQAEQELIESERRFSELLENVELVSVMLDREGGITYCNEYLLCLTGWQYEEVIGKNWFGLFLPPELAYLKEAFFAPLLAGQPEARHHENEILTRSGERRMIRWNNSVLRSATGEENGMASIGEDITESVRTEQKLAKLQRQSELILESVVEGIYVIDIGGRIILPNLAAARMLGYSINELSGMPAHATMHYARKDGTVFPKDECSILATMRDGAVRKVDGEVYWRKDGSSFQVEYTASPIRDDQHEITGAVVTFRDISERKVAEAKIIYLNRVYAVLSGINTLIVRVQGRAELFSEACRIAVEKGGFRMAMIGAVDKGTMKIVPVASAGKNEELVAAIRNILSTGELAANTMVARAVREKQAVISNDSQNDPQVLLGNKYAEFGVRSMAIFPLIVSGEAIGALALYAGEIEFFLEDEMTLLTELAGDISFAIDHIDKQERLNYLAYYDALTGLANRTLFIERVAQYMRSADSNGHKLALCLIDLERFRNINDSLGRSTGDELLRQVAEWLTRNTGDANLLARIDADHFAMVLPEIRQEGDLIHLIEKMTQDFNAHPFHLNDSDFRIAAKAGITLFPDDGNDADTLFKNAEAALKKAKVGGDQYLFYTQKMTAAVAGKLTLENQLRRAIDNEEFVLYYQPKLNLASGKVTSAEALIRWNDPLTGLVPPDKFIPILEETGLINEVGRWALRTAIADNLRWRNAGLPAVRVAVNVSALQLHRQGFIAEVEQAVSVDAHATEGLELEITESLVMDNVERNIATLQAIRAMGITIAIDDFGTGFSSLSYLAKLPVTTLKIDRSFIIEMTTDPEGLALVLTIINLAHAFKLKVVAEGVETEEQSHLLSLLGCDEIQGFLFSKPVPCAEFEARFLAAN